MLADFDEILANAAHSDDLTVLARPAAVSSILVNLIHHLSPLVVGCLPPKFWSLGLVFRIHAVIFPPKRDAP